MCVCVCVCVCSFTLWVIDMAKYTEDIKKNTAEFYT